MDKNKIQLAIFKPNQTSQVAKLLGFDLRKTMCCICNKKINSKKIGHFVHYKHKPATLCVNGRCFKIWLIEEKLDFLSNLTKSGTK